jgi:hypothetical protein|tara:strand:+ start:206 stop:616 length:411 start_codon:yes stop_codon:yes gene_type:complete
MKGFWNKFTTRFAVPVLIVTQVITLYDGWESRTESRQYELTLKRCIVEHSHTEEHKETGVSVDGEKWEWVEESGVVLPRGCDIFSSDNILTDSFKPDRTMDRWLGKIFWTYKNYKDKVIAWYENIFVQERLKDMRG